MKSAGLFEKESGLIYTPAIDSARKAFIIRNNSDDGKSRRFKDPTERWGPRLKARSGTETLKTTPELRAMSVAVPRVKGRTVLAVPE